MSEIHDRMPVFLPGVGPCGACSSRERFDEHSIFVHILPRENRVARQNPVPKRIEAGHP